MRHGRASHGRALALAFPSGACVTPCDYRAPSRPATASRTTRRATAVERMAGEQEEAPPCLFKFFKKSLFLSNFTGTSKRYAPRARRNHFTYWEFSRSVHTPVTAREREKTEILWALGRACE